MLREELETIAFLAKIEIKENEKEKYLKDVGKIVDYIEFLQDPDTTNLKPTTHVTGLRNVWREDVVKACPKEIIDMMLDSSPEKEESFYKVKKVISD
ncbi:MAG: Asp-tRNA(Asn)/Glu-tRNA(Gln) amidotransferase subunit GatC [Endomicrobium sp.]|jgi:aspartyl-tRNA(Asn)/glutamyl-tRNA(Gln) amidotransferase subunit C|nr:Asp-tRNA(Asn)/Glu-tRNA(Gln) amidotransferase subunit GatC [Endomicrobium sp.]